MRLSRMLHHDQYAQRAKALFEAFSDTLSEAPASIPQMVAAWQFSQAPACQAFIAGDPHSASGRQLARNVLRDFHPDLVVLYSRDATILSSDDADAVAAMRPVGGLPALYLCENFVCREPVTSPEKARRLLARASDVDQGTNPGAR
ncbi:MAG TPA: hypothetical protein VFS35_02330 [Terrimicrobiaceae bacterium]|nr:hypothetical protein [Terrimicrobiaceae bacterium]